MSDTAPDGATRRSNHIPSAGEEVVPPPVNRPPSVQTTDAATPRPMWILPAITGILGLAIGAVIGATVASGVVVAQQQAEAEAAAAAAEAAKSDLFADAARRCGATGVVEIEDDGRTMIVDGEGEDFGSGDVTFTEIDCLIDAVGAPAAVKELMYQTRSLDGRQSGDWDDVTASWSYHPDDGLDIIFEIVD